VRKVRPGENKLTRFKGLDAVANKSGSCTFQYHKKLVFGVGMPYRVKMLFVQVTDHEYLGPGDARLV
jgi:hypothetical protein